MADGFRLDDLLAPEGVIALDAVGPVEVLVGVPALNQKHSVARVVDAVATGLATAFPTRKTAVLVADAGSRDGTLEAVESVRERVPAGTSVTAVRLPGPARRGRATLAILAAAERLAAPACVLTDADLVGFEPGWIAALVEPLLRGEAHYVSPAYSRTVAEGTLTTNLLAPLARALYGRGLQQPLGGCVGVAAELVRQALAADPGAHTRGSHGVELHLATETLASDRTITEVHLGRKRTEPGPVPADLATILAETVGPLFDLMARHHAIWRETRRAVPVRRVGGEPVLGPAEGAIRVDRMVQGFRLGLKDLLPVWEQILTDETLARLYPLGILATDEFRFPAALWARVVSDFALAHHARRVARDHLLRALAPLYLGRVAAFLLESEAWPAARLPELTGGVDRAFEAEREYLVARWR